MSQCGSALEGYAAASEDATKDSVMLLSFSYLSE